MAFTSRLLSRSRKFYGARVITQHEHGIVHFFVKEAVTTLPIVKGDGLAPGQTRNSSSPIPSDLLWKPKNNDLGQKHHIRRFSTTSDASDDLVIEEDFFHFISSAFDKHEGPNHCWLNKNGIKMELLKKGGPYLVLVGAFFGDAILNCHCEHIVMFEKVKSLQQRYPSLRVFGFQSSSPVHSLATRSMIIKSIMEENITFPILLSEKKFIEMSNEPCYLLLKDCKTSLIHREWNIELEVIVKDLEEFNLSWDGDPAAVKESSNVKANHTEVIEEPCDCSPFRNLFLYYPSCISADDCGNRLFLSDTNHHRIIVTDGDGEIIDCIGSSPGFEDGEFDSAKLLRPAGSVYHDGEDCLYFVDSENQAIRRAHMEKRELETVYPVHNKRTSGIWNWILDKLAVGRKFQTESRELEKDSLSYPWHLMKSGEDDLLVISRSFETLWVMSMASGEVKEVCKGLPNIMEIHGRIIMERASLLEEISTHVLQQKVDSKLSLQKFPYAGLVSSIAGLQNNVIFCDPVGQRVFKCCRGSADVTSIQFTNMSLLGLPYWMACPLENVVLSGNPYGGQRNYHRQCFNVLPGRCDIRVTVRIPEYTVLAAPLHEDCIWRQARGAAAEISSPEVATASADKVGVAQKWFDELDNLAFSHSPVDSTILDEDKHKVVLDANTVHIDCAINISPGTSEVVISAVLYLKLHKTGASLGNQVRENVKRLLGLQEKLEDDACLKLLLESCEDAREIVFMKPLHLRIRLDCGDHPAARTSKEVIPTDSILDVNFTLD